MYTLTINITKEVLKEAMYCGTPGSGRFASTHCGVAVAIRDIFPHAAVGMFNFSIDGRMGPDSESIDIKLPFEARQFICEFDNLVSTPEKRLEMKELSFDVNLPDKVIQAIDIEEIKQILKDSKTLELHEC